MQGIPLGLKPFHPTNPDQLAFIEANGLDPADVTAGQIAQVDGGKLTVRVIARRDNKTRILNDAGDGYVTEKRTVPLLSAPENHNLRSL
jgi:hypothetical protein